MKAPIFLTNYIKKVGYYFYRFYKSQENEYRKKFYSEKTLPEILIKGEDIYINGRIKILYPFGLSMGSNIHIGDNAHFDCRGGLIIGDHTHISRNVTIYTTNHNYEGGVIPYSDELIPASVTLGPAVWIGMNVSIAPGVSIGKGAIIGMGSVISKDVLPGEIVVSANQRVIKKRNLEAFNTKLAGFNFGGINGLEVEGRPYFGKITPVAKHSSGKFGDVVFVLSTGRSGSNSIANFANQHPDVTAYHEPFYNQLKIHSINFLAGKIDRKTLKNKIIEIYSTLSIADSRCIYLESDQKLVSFIDILYEVFPRAKFIWLIREPSSFLKSARARGWFKEDFPVFNEKTVLLQQKYSSQGCRVTGRELNFYTPKEWEQLNLDDRILWYWNFWNNKIEQFFQTLSVDQRLLLKLENLEQSGDKFFNFLQVREKINTKPKVTNTIRKKDLLYYDSKVNSQHLSESINYYNSLKT